MAIGPQMVALKKGVDIICATPGRIADLTNEGLVDLSNVRFFVLDEADALMAQHHTLVMKLHNAVPKTKMLQVLLFSATLHSASVKQLGQKLCRFPTWVDLKGKGSIPEVFFYFFENLNFL